MTWLISIEFGFLDHLCMHIGLLQAHMSFVSAITLNSEISHLSIGLTFSPAHFGQHILAMLPPVEASKRPGSFRSRAFYFRFRHGRTACTRRRVRLHRASTAVSLFNLTLHPLSKQANIGGPLVAAKRMRR